MSELYIFCGFFRLFALCHELDILYFSTVSIFISFCNFKLCFFQLFTVNLFNIAFLVFNFVSSWKMLGFSVLFSFNNIGRKYYPRESWINWFFQENFFIFHSIIGPVWWTIDSMKIWSNSSPAFQFRTHGVSWSCENISGEVGWDRIFLSYTDRLASFEKLKQLFVQFWSLCHWIRFNALWRISIAAVVSESQNFCFRNVTLNLKIEGLYHTFLWEWANPSDRRPHKVDFWRKPGPHQKNWSSRLKIYDFI